MGSATDFGALILERKFSAMIWSVLWVGAVLLGGWGALALNASVPDVSLAATLFVLALVLLVAPFLLPGRVVRFYERGLTEKVPLKGVYSLRYEDVEHMTWRAVKPRVGVTVQAEFVAGGRRIRFDAMMDTGGRLQQSLESLRDRIAPYVAARLERRVRANQPCPWGGSGGARVRLQRDGIAYRPERFLGPGDEQIVPWATPLTFVFRNGGFAVKPSGGQEALFALACEERDFYPGFLVFRAMGQVRPVEA